MLGVHMSLQPVLISEHSDKFEMIVVEIKASKEIRIIAGYGPQENSSTKMKMSFFAKLEEEIVSAKMANKSIIIQMDANSKLGKTIIPNDPHDQTPNGAVLAGIVKRNALIVTNCLTNKCRGLITRRRVTVDSIEESIIDYVIISDDLLDDLVEVVIDEDKKYALSKIIKRKHLAQVVQSDHNVMFSKFKLSWSFETKMQIEEVFNLKNRDCQAKFKEDTSNSDKLSSIFDSDEDLNKQTIKFLKGLKRVIHRCLKNQSKKTKRE